MCRIIIWVAYYTTVDAKRQWRTCHTKISHSTKLELKSEDRIRLFLAIQNITEFTSNRSSIKKLLKDCFSKKKCQLREETGYKVESTKFDKTC